MLINIRYSFCLGIFLLLQATNMIAQQHLNTLTPGGTHFANTSIWAGMIITDPIIAEVLGRDFHKVPQGVSGTPSANALLRIENAKLMAKQLPFPVPLWYSVYTQSCPDRKTKGNDRGVAMAHHQIWADFEYRGRRGIDKEVATDRDILVVFEDDAVVAVKNVTDSLYKELSQMNTDLLFLGWCYGRRHMPMCTHAYAVTRRGVRKILNEWDTCSTYSIDGQWHFMVRDKHFTWAKAKPTSYADVKPGFEDNPHYFTRGIFIQKGGLVSFNHHGFQNNANG